jgi:hypothetical protein
VDEAVLRAIAKWPDVPAAYGWLSLDRRGNWFVKGERITSPAIVDFIGRNYACDDAGRWFFQNGPQRVFVTLAYTPYVLRTEPGGTALQLRTHTGQTVAAIAGACLDEDGALLLQCAGSIGLLHDRDLEAILPHLRDTGGANLDDASVEAWLSGDTLDVRLHVGDVALAVGRIDRAAVPSRFRFNPAPGPRPGEPEC